jgi:oligoendopeptidase F
MRLQINKRSTLIVLASLLLLALAVNVIAKPNTLVRDEIPDKYKWTLNDIYPDWQSWEKDLVYLQELMDQYAAMQGTLNSGPEQILKAYKLDDELGMTAYKVYRYPALARALDTRDNDMSSKVQQVQIAFSKFGVATSWFSPELLAIPWETMKSWLDQTAELAPYRYSIENLYRQQKHVLDAEKEQLLSYYSPFSGSPVSVYSMLATSDIQFPDVTLSTGETVTMTRGNYGQIMSTNRIQTDRKLAFENHYQVYEDNINTYAAIYNGVLQRDWASAQARNYSSCLEAFLDGDNVPVEVYETLIETVKQNTAPLIRYMKLRKKALGLEEYHLYDGGIPIVDFDKTYDYDEVGDWITESVKPLGKEYHKKIKKVFQGGWVDVFENEGKETGAFSGNVYGVHPYILMNYNETLESVFTLAHEAGHAMHSILSNENQPFATSSYTIFVAEVASTMNEALFLDYMLDRATDPLEKVALLQQAIENIVGTFYSQVQFADFEYQAHKMVEMGQPITSDGLKTLLFMIDDEYYGDGVEMDDLYGALWARISHFFEVPFYVYKYATCYATSAQLYKEMKSDNKKVRQDAMERYMTLLKSGGNDYPMEQLKKAGVDLSKPVAFQAVVEQLDDLVTQLEIELEKL